MRVSVSIMAHPDRTIRAGTLREALGVGPVPTSWDSEGPPSRDPQRIWRNARAAWSMHDPDSDWHLLLQDDALPAPHLMEALPTILGHVQSPAVVSLYIGTGRPVPGVWGDLARRADAAGATWIVGPAVMWGVALALPTRLIPDMLKWADTRYGIPDDMRVGRWARRQGMEAWFPWPSLVDHPDRESLIKNGDGRVARRFLGGDARAADYGGPVIRYGRMR